MTEYYVDPTRADDTGAGTSTATAKKTITAGAALCAAGDRLNLRSNANHVLTTTVNITTTGTRTARITIEGYTTTAGDGGVPTITSATSSVDLFTVNVPYYTFKSLNLTHTGATRGDGFRVLDAKRTIIRDCTISGCFRGIYNVGYLNDNLSITNCDISSCTSHGVLWAYSNAVEVRGCSFHGNTGDGFTWTAQSGGLNGCTFVDCKSYANGGNGIGMTDLTTVVLDRTTLHGNTGAGLKITSATGVDLFLGLSNNLFTSNGGYGVDLTGTAAERDNSAMFNRNNWYGSGAVANTSGTRNNLSAGTNDLSGDPQYTNAATGNFTPTNAAVQAGFPTGWIGAVQPVSGGGGGTVGYARGRVVNSA